MVPVNAHEEAVSQSGSAAMDDYFLSFLTWLIPPSGRILASFAASGVDLEEEAPMVLPVHLTGFEWESFSASLVALLT